MKKLARNTVAFILGYQVRKLVKKNNLKIIGVAGSIGKTSTKLAIASILKTSFKVQSQEGNYNDLVTVPLVFFGEPIPSLFNPLAWIGVFWRNQKQLGRPFPYDVVVLELGTDGPGQIQEFKAYLNLEIGVVTAITPEHMEFFASLDAVAKEELSISGFSSLILANKDLCDEKYLKNVSQLVAYSLKDASDYNSGKKSQAEQYSIAAAAAVGKKLGMDEAAVKKGVKNIKAAPGRMRQLDGINSSIIIDDSYNSSPAAVKLALDYIYKIESPQKIAVLGNMNELGGHSQKAHEEVGNYCDPKHLDLVVTIGPDANKFLAPAAEAKGCEVKQFDNPYEAGDFVKSQVKPKAVILVKGSQNKVFAEETVKILLADPSNAEKLVRQTPQWLKIKARNFSK
jgi:UDP-N-acetylmuramoyl-tripeptide--D-alanyl-D-alanine ligase